MLLGGSGGLLLNEAGPTVTHGGMAFGAGTLAARKYGARELVDPRPYAVGSLRHVFEEHPHMGAILPAMGYGAEQVRELEQTIAATPCDLVVLGTPVDLRRVIRIARPTARVTYEMEEVGRPTLKDVLEIFLAQHA